MTLIECKSEAALQRWRSIMMTEARKKTARAQLPIVFGVIFTYIRVERCV